MAKLENQESVGEEAFVCGGGLPGRGEGGGGYCCRQRSVRLSGQICGCLSDHRDALSCVPSQISLRVWWEILGNWSKSRLQPKIIFSSTDWCRSCRAVCLKRVGFGGDSRVSLFKQHSSALTANRTTFSATPGDLFGFLIFAHNKSALSHSHVMTAAICSTERQIWGGVLVCNITAINKKNKQTTKQNWIDGGIMRFGR